MLDSRRLRVLCEVARHGSFSAAAESLGYTQPAISRLRAGELDLALSHDAIDIPPVIELIHLFDDPMYVAMRAGHPLAESPALELADFATEPWMLATTQTCPDSRLFLRACHNAGFEPQIAFQNDDYPAILGFVAAGVGVAMIPDMVARSVRDDVVVRDLDPPAPPRPILAAVASGYRSPAVSAMLAVLEELSGEWVATRPPLSFAGKSDQFART